MIFGWTAPREARPCKATVITRRAPQSAGLLALFLVLRIAIVKDADLKEVLARGDREIILPGVQVLTVAPRTGDTEIRGTPANLFGYLGVVQLAAAGAHKLHGGHDLLFRCRLVARFVAAADGCRPA